MMERKIKGLKDLKDILSRLKREKKKIIFTNGCFDLLHVGHVSYLEEAKREGDILVVAVNSDRSVRKIKGEGRPIVNQDDRMKLLASLESVDYVTLFDEDNPLNIVKDLKPDVIAKAADWKKGEVVGGEYVEKIGGRVVISAFCNGYSSTALIEKIRKAKSD